MGLDQLPNELVLFILNHLSADRDMSSLTRVNWRFYNLLTPGLYQHNARYSNSSALRFSTVRYGLTSTVKKAIDGGADPYRADQTALSDSAETGRQEICELLLNYQPDLLEIRDQPSGFTPLCNAVARDRTASVKLLLSHGANPDVRDASGRTPLFLACYEGYAAIADTLLSASKLHPDQYGTLLLVAIRKGHEPVIRLLLSKGADPCFGRRPTGKRVHVSPPSPLHYAVENQQPEVLKLLLNWTGEEPNVLDRNDLFGGRTPLQAAVICNNEDLVEILLGDPQVDVNRTTPTVKRTALLEAELKRNEKIINLLLGAGADPDIPGVKGLTARMLQEAPTEEVRKEILERYSPYRDRKVMKR